MSSRGRATTRRSLIGLGLVGEGRLGVSLGTSDTVFGAMPTPRVDPPGTGHVFGAPTGGFMGLTVLRQRLAGARARPRRLRPGLGRLLAPRCERTPAGNGGALMLPWFEPEITPPVAPPGVQRYGLDPDDAPGRTSARSSRRR